MSQNISIPSADAFEDMRDSHGLILSEFEVSRVCTALQGIHAIAATLQQRERDIELGVKDGDGLTIAPRAALGLIAALATCAEYIECTMQDGGTLGAHAFTNTTAYEHLNTARLHLIEENRKAKACAA